MKSVMQAMLNALKNLSQGSKRKQYANALITLINVEKSYLKVDFSLEYLIDELQVDQDYFLDLYETIYGVSFFNHTRKLRIEHLKTMVHEHGQNLSLTDYAKLSGFSYIKIMLYAFKQETGLDFDDFCKFVLHQNDHPL